MKFLLCFCLKRNRAAYNVSSRTISFANSNSITSTVTSAPLPLSFNLPIESSGGEIGVNNEYPAPTTTSIECDGYAKIRPVQSPQPLFDDDTELYATVDKTRIAKNAIRIKADTTNTIDAALPQGSLSASTTTFSRQPIPSRSSHLFDFTVASDHSPLPLQVYGNITSNTITNNHDNTSNHRRSTYDDGKKRESLQYRDQDLKIEEEHIRQKQEFRENYHLYANREQETTNNDDIYAELSNGSASGTVYQNCQSHSYSRSSNDSKTDDDLSERYATIIEVNNTEQ